MCPGTQHVGKISLVDLAGSERLDKTGTGDNPIALLETKSINKSLEAWPPEKWSGGG